MAYLATIARGTEVTAETIEVFDTPNNGISSLGVYINVTAVSGDSPTVTPYIETLGSDHVWYTVWTTSAITEAGQTVASISPDQSTNPAVIGPKCRLRLEIGGTDTPTVTLSASIVGR